MGILIFLLFVSSLLRGKALSQTCGEATNSIPEYKPVSETDLPGTMIFNVSKTPIFNISYSISSPNHSVLLTYFRDFQNDSFFSFYLYKSLDLEELYSILGIQLVGIEFSFSCGEDILIDDIELQTTQVGSDISYARYTTTSYEMFDELVFKKVHIPINPENEFDPYINISGNLNIPENTTVGTVVYNLLPRTSDKDRPVSGPFLFDVNNSHFRIDGSSSGEIKLSSPLDYESGQRMFLLNITVKDTADDKARNSTATLRIYVTDVDDQGPRYDYPGCVAQCLIPEYTAITTLSFTGPLTVQPASIKAHDLDTLNFSITYRFYDEISGGSSSDDSSGFFRIDQNTGTVHQLKPASEAIWPTQRLLVIAEEVGSSQSAAHAILTVRVLTRDPTLNGTSVVPPDRSTPTENSLLPAVIALSVLMGIFLIAAAIVIFLMQRRHRKMVSPDDTKSEPSTEEEEIHSERSEEDKTVLPTRAKIMKKALLASLSNPLTDPLFLNRPLPKKGAFLEPLQMKDTGIGTNNTTRKKKKSRSRFKKKENEIFDGTKEDNMEADPKFYESPDKSRIKRSTRSMKAPTEHIVVQNDNVDSVHM